MSGMSAKPVSSLLPDDIEQQLAGAKNLIFKLGEQKKSLDTDIVSKQKILEELNIKLGEVNTELGRVNSMIDSKNAELSERERKIAQKESALDVYANALEEKENKIKKYLTVFEGMKDVIS